VIGGDPRNLPFSRPSTANSQRHSGPDPTFISLISPLSAVLSSTTMRTQALVVEEPGAKFTFREIDLDELRSDEVLVEIVATGICHTDLKSASGQSIVKFPFVAGHEGSSPSLNEEADL
jgi:Alcohol dehydrogenase GroES-like domain